MQKLNINLLILDFNLYPRTHVDDQHCKYMLESMSAGVELPPVIVDKKSKRVIDGFHRVTAWRKFFKHNKEIEPLIPVVLKEYKSEMEMFADAMRYNSAHGRMLTENDRTHCIIRADELGLTIDAVTAALSITVDKYGKLKTQRIGELHVSPHLPGGKKSKFIGKLFIPLKRTISHKAGKELTARQVEVNKKLSGMSQVFYVNQIIDLIESDLLDKENSNLMERLHSLYELLKEINKKTA